MKKIVVVFLFFLTENLAYSQIKTQSFLNKKNVYLGDFLEYHIKIQHPSRIEIKNFEIYEILKDTSGVENFILYKKEHKINKSILSKDLKENFVFYLIPIKLGKIKINEFVINYVDKLTKEEKTLIIPPLEVEVLPYPKPKDKKFDGEIIDIKGQIWIRSYLWLVILIIILVSILSYVLYQYQRKPSLSKENDIQKSLDLKEEALQKLNNLWNKNYIEQGLIKEFYLELTEIIRWYIEKKYEINALELTTEELFLALKKKVDKSYNIKLKSFLENSDLAKFAKYVPQKEQILKDFETSKEFIL